jgi:hypothetical protein
LYQRRSVRTPETKVIHDIKNILKSFLTIDNEYTHLITPPNVSKATFSLIFTFKYKTRWLGKALQKRSTLYIKQY